jgi:hypothetical protein
VALGHGSPDRRRRKRQRYHSQQHGAQYDQYGHLNISIGIITGKWSRQDCDHDEAAGGGM